LSWEKAWEFFPHRKLLTEKEIKKIDSELNILM
jgi:hypothetical protein